MSGSKRTFSGGKPQASEYYKILHPETPASDILQMAIDKAIGPLAPVYLAQDQEDAMIHMMEHPDSPKQYELLTDSQLPILSPGTLQEITTEEYRHSDENSDETDYSSDNEDEESVNNSVASIQAVTDSSSETDEEDKIEHTKCQIRAEAEAIERAHTESKKRTEAYASNKTEDTPSTYQVPTGLKFHKRGNATNSPIKTQKVLPVLSPRKLNFNRKNKPSHRPVVKMVNHIKNNVDATAPPPVNSTISGAHQSSQVVKQEVTKDHSTDKKIGFTGNSVQLIDYMNPVKKSIYRPILPKPGQPCSSSSVPAGKKDEGGRKKMEPSQTKKMDQSRVKKATENPPVKKQKLSVLKPEEEKPSATHDEVWIGPFKIKIRTEKGEVTVGYTDERNKSKFKNIPAELLQMLLIRQDKRDEILTKMHKYSH